MKERKEKRTLITAKALGSSCTFCNLNGLLFDL